MRAAVLSAQRTAEIADVPAPVPGPREARVRLEGCGVCGSDLPVWESRPWFEYPRAPGAPGHEGWGWIDAVGREVSGLAPGTRVAGLTYRAYAEQDLACAAHLVPLPAELEGRAFPGEALGCAVNIFQRASIAPGDRVAVVGVGFLGTLLVQLAARAGAIVAAVSRRESALQRAREAGAAEVASLTAPPERASFDVVVEAAGRQETLDVAGELVRERGRLVIAGFHQDGLRTVDMCSWNWRGIDVINAHERDPRVSVEGIRLAVRWVAQGRLDPDALYTHRFPLECVGDALQAACEREDGFMKALVLAA